MGGMITLDFFAESSILTYIFATQSLCTHASANYVLILFNTIIGTKQIDHDNIYTVQNIKNI